MKKKKTGKLVSFKNLTLKDGIKIVRREIKSMNDEKFNMLEDLLDSIDRRVVSFFNSKGKMMRKTIREKYSDNAKGL